MTEDLFRRKQYRMAILQANEIYIKRHLITLEAYFARQLPYLSMPQPHFRITPFLSALPLRRKSDRMAARFRRPLFQPTGIAD